MSPDSARFAAEGAALNDTANASIPINSLLVAHAITAEPSAQARKPLDQLPLTRIIHEEQ